MHGDPVHCSKPTSPVYKGRKPYILQYNMGHHCCKGRICLVVCVGVRWVGQLLKLASHNICDTFCKDQSYLNRKCHCTIGKHLNYFPIGNSVEASQVCLQCPTLYLENISHNYGVAEKDDNYLIGRMNNSISFNNTS